MVGTKKPEYEGYSTDKFKKTVLDVFSKMFASCSKDINFQITPFSLSSFQPSSLSLLQKNGLSSILAFVASHEHYILLD